MHLILSLESCLYEKHRDDFPHLNPLLIPLTCNKHQHILKICCIDTIYKDINHIFTILSQIKGIVTKTVFSMQPHTFAYPIYSTDIKHTYFMFGPNLDPPSYPSNELYIFALTLYLLRGQNRC